MGDIMSIPNHRDDKKVSSRGNLERPFDDQRPDRERIGDLEEKVSFLEVRCAALKILLKFITDLLIKDRCK